MTTQKELAVIQSEAQLPAQVPSVGEMLQAVIAKGVSPDSVDALAKLCDLYERMEDRNAEKQFAQAFVALQAELPVIVAKTAIKNRGMYEKFEDLMPVVGPLLAKNGFTVSFSNDFKESRIIQTCHLSHIGGHTRSNPFAVRVGGRADSDTQADCKAATTAKRNALCNALNLVIKQDILSSEDDDASIEGDPNAKVTPAQADELERRVKETNSDVSAFLRFASAKSFADIPARKYPELDALLTRKEKLGR